MPPKPQSHFNHMTVDELASAYAAAADFYELIEREPAFGRALPDLLAVTLCQLEEALAARDPLIARQPVVVRAEHLTVEVA